MRKVFQMLSEKAKHNLTPVHPRYQVQAYRADYYTRGNKQYRHRFWGVYDEAQRRWVMMPNAAWDPQLFPYNAKGKAKALRLAAKLNREKDAKDWVAAKTADRKAWLDKYLPAAEAALARAKTIKQDVTYPDVIVRSYEDVRKLRFLKGDPRIICFKLSRGNGEGPHNPTTKPILTCAPGNVLTVPWAETDRNLDCAAGVNVACADWVLRNGTRHEWHPSGVYIDRVIDGMRFWRVIFRKSDIASLPNRNPGKFRVYNAVVVEELSLTQMLAIRKGELN